METNENLFDVIKNVSRKTVYVMIHFCNKAL